MQATRTEKAAAKKLSYVLQATACAFVVAATARCARTGPAVSPAEDVSLRIGVAQGTFSSNGVGQLVQILAAEGLARIDQDGRPIPSLSKGWELSPDGLILTVHLRPGVNFHDGSLVNASVVAAALNNNLREFMGSASNDVAGIEPVNEMDVAISLRRRSPFLLEALEAPIWKPGTKRVGTGPYMTVGSTNPSELRANPTYYLGRPAIDRIVVSPLYPSVRAAWADLLRDRVDMLYEVGTDALDSLTSSKNTGLYTYVRHYQYTLVLNTRTGPLRPSAIRRALNEAIDRDALIKDALDGRAIPSFGLVWPQHWAVSQKSLKPVFNPHDATITLQKELGTSRLRFRCLVVSSSERIGLVLKRQLEAVGVDMSLQEASADVLLKALETRDFDAVLLEPVSGPNLLRPYVLWHSGGNIQPHDLGNAQLDAAFDRIRGAASDDDYRAAVADLQKLTMDDPPALFLAWGERARAVSRKFDVAAEPGVDILRTLRLGLWRPSNALEYVRRN